VEEEGERSGIVFKKEVDKREKYGGVLNGLQSSATASPAPASLFSPHSVPPLSTTAGDVRKRRRSADQVGTSLLTTSLPNTPPYSPEPGKARNESRLPQSHLALPISVQGSRLAAMLAATDSLPSSTDLLSLCSPHKQKRSTVIPAGRHSAS
jgi:hypothetical protein